MALLGFKRQFEAKIVSGIKRHTIRADRKISIKVGDMLHLYVDPRQATMRLLFRSRCTKVLPLEMRVDSNGSAQVYIEGIQLSEDERESLAYHDGFDDWRQMAEFWNGHYPFKGTITHWAFPPESAAESHHD